MAEEAGAEAGALARALDQAGHVGEHEFAVVVDPHDAELRVQRRERVVGDLRAGRATRRRATSTCRHWAGRRARHRRSASAAARPTPRGPASRDRRGAAPGWSRSCNGRCRSRRRRRAAARRAAPGRVRSASSGFLVLGENLGADRHAQHEVARRRAPVRLRARAAAAVLRPEMLLVAIVDQRVQVVGGVERRCRRRVPPSPPSGPPNSMNFSRRKLTQPRPPSPLFR